MKAPTTLIALWVAISMAIATYWEHRIRPIRSGIAWAEERFEAAGLDFPDVDVVVHDSLFECDGHVGLYHPGRALLLFCCVALMSGRCFTSSPTPGPINT
jgi:hypothetical protein